MYNMADESGMVLWGKGKVEMVVDSHMRDFL
jgi:hypothetical protein